MLMHSPTALLLLLLVQAPFAMGAEPPKLDQANTAWMITASVLVLFMTLPGLALFYAGLVRSKNVLSVLMQCFAITCMATLAWVVAGYSLAFGDGGTLNAWYGGWDKSFLAPRRSRWRRSCWSTMRRAMNCSRRAPWAARCSTSFSPSTSSSSRWRTAAR